LQEKHDFELLREKYGFAAPQVRLQEQHEQRTPHIVPAISVVAFKG